MSRADDSGRHDATEAPGATPATSDVRGGTVAHSVLALVKEIVIVVALAVVLSLIAKTWLVQTFWIPSASMMSTLVRDDRVLVSKLTPEPFELKRGDVVVFEDPGGWLEPDAVVPRQEGFAESVNDVLTWVGLLPEDEGNHLIKRVIGLPGDRVTCCGTDGRMSVNGTPIDEPYLHPGDTPSDVPFDVTVPAGRLWVMGDHRSNSRDSRFQDGEGDLGQVGSVPVDHVVGRGFAVVWPLERLAWLGRQDGTFGGVSDPSNGPTSTGTP